MTDYTFDLNHIDDQTASLKEYMKVYFDKGSLICAPFGNLLESPIEAVLEDMNFEKNKTDKWGWWHVSCTYKKGEPIVLTVANSENTWTNKSAVKPDLTLPRV